MRPYLEKPFTKNRTDGVAPGEGYKFRPQYLKKRGTETKLETI
jgi:hypothetical protein